MATQTEVLELLFKSRGEQSIADAERRYREVEERVDSVNQSLRDNEISADAADAAFRRLAPDLAKARAEWEGLAGVAEKVKAAAAAQQQQADAAKAQADANRRAAAAMADYSTTMTPIPRKTGDATKAFADYAGMAPKATAAAVATAQATTQAAEATARSSSRIGLGINAIAQGVEDMQYSISAGMNNMGNAAMMFGASGGVVAAITLAGVAVTQFTRHWDDLAEAMGIHSGQIVVEIDGISKQIDELNAKKIKTAVDYHDLQELEKQQQRNIDAQNRLNALLNKQTEVEKESGQEVEKALTGEDARKAIADMVRLQLDALTKQSEVSANPNSIGGIRQAAAEKESRAQALIESPGADQGSHAEAEKLRAEAKDLRENQLPKARENLKKQAADDVGIVQDRAIGGVGKEQAVAQENLAKMLGAVGANPIAQKVRDFNQQQMKGAFQLMEELKQLDTVGVRIGHDADRAVEAWKKMQGEIDRAAGVLAGAEGGAAALRPDFTLEDVQGRLRKSGTPEELIRKHAAEIRERAIKEALLKVGQQAAAENKPFPVVAGAKVQKADIDAAELARMAAGPAIPDAAVGGNRAVPLVAPEPDSDAAKAAARPFVGQLNKFIGGVVKQGFEDAAKGGVVPGGAMIDAENKARDALKSLFKGLDKKAPAVFEAAVKEFVRDHQADVFAAFGNKAAAEGLNPAQAQFRQDQAEAARDQQRAGGLAADQFGIFAANQQRAANAFDPNAPFFGAADQKAAGQGMQGALDNLGIAPDKQADIGKALNTKQGLANAPAIVNQLMADGADQKQALEQLPNVLNVMAERGVDATRATQLVVNQLMQNQAMMLNKFARLSQDNARMMQGANAMRQFIEQAGGNNLPRGQR